MKGGITFLKRTVIPTELSNVIVQCNLTSSAVCLSTSHRATSFGNIDENFNETNPVLCYKILLLLTILLLREELLKHNHSTKSATIQGEHIASDD